MAGEACNGGSEGNDTQRMAVQPAGKGLERNENLLQALRRLKVETGSLACMGCGYERSCSVRGSAIEAQPIKWIEIPEDGGEK